jgi:hypothetical protein
MPDMKDADAIIVHPVEDFEWISNKNGNVDAMAADNLWPAGRIRRDLNNDVVKEGLDLGRNRVAIFVQGRSADGQKISGRPLGIVDCHALRKERNAAATSFASATPLCSA